MADLSTQAILLAFDKLGEHEPLPAEVVAAELDADEAAVVDRLAELEREDVLARAEDDGDTYWWAKLGPQLDPELAEELGSEPDGETYTLEEVRKRIE
ncbi:MULTISPECIES: hypothetical protein [Halolamina]|uniref:Uncharacterized protein n=1 Tax=Halolamina pelagica TaxID=699431 RepID=A0A1I5VPU1_9EURY|nr:MULTISPECIES: hypothetical protein [Halolamina]NHX37834.1 hypothetical protein [Halolamina sp. R1-12]SFQ09443.1 hypothetical protein SAMN05216277_11919 [Halolamina pelagica]